MFTAETVPSSMHVDESVLVHFVLVMAGRKDCLPAELSCFRQTFLSNGPCWSVKYCFDKVAPRCGYGCVDSTVQIKERKVSS